LAATALSFCPVISLIGAKRPQHTAWNFVVGSLWAIVVLPAAETFFLRRGQPLAMGDARGWFLWLLILLGPINFLPTRNWLSAVFLAAGQVVALGQYLPLVRRELTVYPELTGVGLAVAALVAAWTRRFTAAPPRQEQPYDRLWLDFRDTFGLFWALRVQERVNAAAKQFGWPCELGWSGLGATELDFATERALRTTMKGLLRRFVNSRWIAQRLPPGLD
jgi:hypothetical protein